MIMSPGVGIPLGLEESGIIGEEPASLAALEQSLGKQTTSFCPDKSTTSYATLDFKSDIENLHENIC